MLPFAVKLDTFLCPEFKCPQCGWGGVLEVKTTAFREAETEERIFKPGDKVVEGWVGIKEVFECGLCPKCLERPGELNLLPVTLLFTGGVFVRAHF
jgi:hypothetical protein